MSSALDLLTDACVGLPVRIQKMFGGHGFFAPNGGMFAGLVTDDQVMLKLADERARADLVSIGGHAWVYEGKGKAMTMSTWIIVPASFYDDQELFNAWARRAHALVPPKKVAGKKKAVPGPKVEKPKQAAAPKRTKAPSTPARTAPQPKRASASKRAKAPSTPARAAPQPKRASASKRAKAARTRGRTSARRG
jgi:TfoX/Sxy family transcriptional regulator of competence genes